MRIIYFGVESKDRKGHFLFDEHFRKPYERDEFYMKVHTAVYPQIDTGFCPKTLGWQEEGKAKITHYKGLTILSFWDRSADGRGGCNSSFIVDGTKTFDEVLNRAKEVFPSIFKRFAFEVTEYLAAEQATV